MSTSAGHGHRAAPRQQPGDVAWKGLFTVGPRLRRYGGPVGIVLGSIAFAVFSTRGLWDGGMLAFGDLPRFPTEPSVFVDGVRQAWADRGFGGPYPSISWFLFLASLVFVTGGDGVQAQQLAMTLWIPVAFCGMAFLCRRYLETSWLLAAIGGILYVATPVSIGLFVGGAVGLIWSYALLPLVIAGAEALRRSNGSNLGWFALPVALLAATSPELLLFGLLVAAIWIAVGHGRTLYAALAAIAFLAALVATLPSLVGRGSVRLSDSLIEKMTADFEYTYDEVTPLNLLRLAGNHGDPMDPLGYNDATNWAYAGYLLIVALVCGVVLRRRGDVFILRLTALAGVVIGALLGIAWLTRTRPEVFADFTPSFVFRNPGKPMMLLAAALVPAAIYGIHRLFEVFPQRKETLRILVAAGVIAYLGAYAGPALSGDWGVDKVRGATFEADRTLLASAQYLKRQEAGAPGRWRAVWLPFDHTDALNLEWIYPYWANEPVPENRDPEIEQTITLVDDALLDLDLRRFHAIADRSAVRWVVVRESADPELDRLLSTDKRMTPVRRGQGFVVWRNSAALPRIRQFSGLKAVATSPPQRPVRYTAGPIVRLSPNALAVRRGWTTYGTRGFSRAGTAIRARTTSDTTWPILARRIPAAANATYLISAWVRTRRASDAHLKVVWYRGAGDREQRALDQDYAEPILSGTNGWTRISSVITSPRGTRFGVLAFLAGRSAPDSPRAAVTWVKDVRISNVFVTDPPSTRAEAVADVVPDIGDRGYEIVEAESLPRSLTRESAAGVRVDGVLVNPGFRTAPPPTLRPLVRPGRTEIVSRAGVTLRPRSGDWQRRGDSAAVVSPRGVAVLPLGLVPAGRYFIAVTGCRIGARAVELVRRGAAAPLTLRGPAGCGRFITTQPTRMRGPTVLRMSLRQQASVATAHAFPVGSRRPLAAAGPLQIGSADTPSPSVAGLSRPGLTLADAYHSGWETSGSDATQFRTFAGFNGFLVNEPKKADGLRFGPQLTRDFLVLLGILGWIAVVCLLFFGQRIVQRLTTGVPFLRRSADLNEQRGRS